MLKFTYTEFSVLWKPLQKSHELMHFAIYILLVHRRHFVTNLQFINKLRSSKCKEDVTESNRVCIIILVTCVCILRKVNLV